MQPIGWRRVDKFYGPAAQLADRHYSRQSIGSGQLLPPGQTLLLMWHDDRAVWGVCRNLDGGGEYRRRCTIFRNETENRSSAMIREATEITVAWWDEHYKNRPPEGLTTEVDPGKVRRKRDPGRCFLRAGWLRVGETTKGLIVLRACV